MTGGRGFEEIREDIEARQRATVWPDTLRNGKSIDAFLWKRDPNAKPVQRIGLVLFALVFLMIAAVIASIPFQTKVEDGASFKFLFLLALLPALLSIRLLRNALLRSKKRRE